MKKLSVVLIVAFIVTIFNINAFASGNGLLDKKMQAKGKTAGTSKLIAEYQTKFKKVLGEIQYEYNVLHDVVKKSQNLSEDDRAALLDLLENDPDYSLNNVQNTYNAMMNNLPKNDTKALTQVFQDELKSCTNVLNNLKDYKTELPNYYIYGDNSQNSAGDNQDNQAPDENNGNMNSDNINTDASKDPKPSTTSQAVDAATSATTNNTSQPQIKQDTAKSTKDTTNSRSGNLGDKISYAYQNNILKITANTQITKDQAMYLINMIKPTDTIYFNGYQLPYEKLKNFANGINNDAKPSDNSNSTSSGVNTPTK